MTRLVVHAPTVGALRRARRNIVNLLDDRQLFDRALESVIAKDASGKWTETSFETF